MAKSPYEVLGIAETATQDEVKKAYRTLAKNRHPDKGGTVDGFTQIQKAYELLSDKKRRSAYDVLHGIVRDSWQQQQKASSNNPFSGTIGWSSGRVQYNSKFVNVMFQQAMAQQAQAQSSFGMAGNSAPPSNKQRPRQTFLIPRKAILQARMNTQPQIHYLGAPIVDEIEIMIDCSLFKDYPVPMDRAILEFIDYTQQTVTIDTEVIEAKYSTSYPAGYIQGELRVRRLGTWQTTP